MDNNSNVCFVINEVGEENKVDIHLNIIKTSLEVDDDVSLNYGIILEKSRINSVDNSDSEHRSWIALTLFLNIKNGAFNVHIYFNFSVIY